MPASSCSTPLPLPSSFITRSSIGYAVCAMSIPSASHMSVQLILKANRSRQEDMQRAARQTGRRWLSSKDTVLTKSSLTKHFNENPEKAMSVFRGLDTLGMAPDSTQLRSILMTLSRGKRDAEVKEVFEYALKRDISINWSDFFRSGLEHTSTPLQLVDMFESAVALNPEKMPTASYITIIRQCLKVNDIERALKLYKHIEHEEFRLHQLNKGVMQVLCEIFKAKTSSNSDAIEKAQKMTMDKFVNRKGKQVAMNDYIEAIAAVDPNILSICLRMILRKETSPVLDHRHKQMQAHIEDSTPIFKYCYANNVGLSQQLFTSYFLKCKHTNFNPREVIEILLAMEKNGIVQPSTATCMSAMHACISQRENDLAIECVRLAIRCNLPLNTRHYHSSFWLCSKTNNKQLAMDLFDRMRKDDCVIPNESTLTALLLNLTTPLDGWDLPEILAYFAKHQVKPTSREYSLLVEILSSTPSIVYPEIDQFKPEQTEVKEAPPRRKTQEEKELAASEAMVSKPKRTKAFKPTQRYRATRNTETTHVRSHQSKERRAKVAVEPKTIENAEESPKKPEPKKDSSCSIM